MTIKDDNKAVEKTTATPIGNINTEPIQTEASISNFINDPNVLALIEKQVQNGIQKALKGTTPKANTTNPTATEKANFARMTYKERLQLFQINPHAYNKLKGGN